MLTKKDLTQTFEKFEIKNSKKLDITFQEFEKKNSKKLAEAFQTFRISFRKEIKIDINNAIDEAIGQIVEIFNKADDRWGISKIG